MNEVSCAQALLPRSPRSSFLGWPFGLFVPKANVCADQYRGTNIRPGRHRRSAGASDFGNLCRSTAPSIRMSPLAPPRWKRSRSHPPPSTCCPRRMADQRGTLLGPCGFRPIKLMAFGRGSPGDKAKLTVRAQFPIPPFGQFQRRLCPSAEVSLADCRPTFQQHPRSPPPTNGLLRSNVLEPRPAAWSARGRPSGKAGHERKRNLAGLPSRQARKPTAGVSVAIPMDSRPTAKPPSVFHKRGSSGWRPRPPSYWSSPHRTVGEYSRRWRRPLCPLFPIVKRLDRCGRPFSDSLPWSSRDVGGAGNWPL